MSERTVECIYCFERKPVSAFDTEHVLPKSFGKFENNLTLKQIVCRECNKAFGRELDEKMAVESIEGIQRFELGIAKPPSKGRTFGTGRRIYPSLQHPEYHGARLRWVNANDGKPGLGVVPDAQVGVKSAEGAFSWYRLRDLPTRDELRESGLTGEIELRIWGCTLDEASRVMRERGFNGVMTELEELGDVFAAPGERLDMIVHSVFDETSARAVAKYAVNYLAYMYPGAARMANFGEIRRFIRYGGRNWSDFVSVSREPSVSNLPRDIQVAGHMLSVTWEPVARRVIGHVSLCDWVLYRIDMGGGFLIPPTYVRSGHFFDTTNRIVHVLTTRPQPPFDPRLKP